MMPSEIFVGAVTFPIPGLSDVWHAAFDRDLTILEIANVFSGIGLIPPPYRFIVDAVNFMKDLVKSVEALTDDNLFSTDLFNAYFPVGSIDFSASANGFHDWRQDEPAWGDGEISDFLADPLHIDTPLTALTPIATAAGKELERILNEDVPEEVRNLPGYQDKVALFHDRLRSLGNGISLSFPIAQILSAVFSICSPARTFSSPTSAFC